MRTVFVVLQPDKKPIVYGSVTALLEDPENPVQMSDRNFRYLQKNGYPIEHSGCIIEQALFITASDARSRETQSRIL